MSSKLSRRQRFSLERLLESKWFLLLLAVAALASGVLIRMKAEESYRDSMAAFCDALFIAAFLALVVDPVLKRGFFRGASKDVFALIYGYSLPPALQAFFDKTIVGTKVVRRDCQLQWKIGRHAGSADRVELRLHVSFHVSNFSRDAYEYTHVVSAISDAPGENGSVDAMYCIDHAMNQFRYRCAKGELIAVKDGLRVAEKDGALRLEARSASEKPRYRVGVHYHSESPLVNGFDQFAFSEVATDAEVIVTVDPEFRDYVFSLIPMPNLDDEPTPPSFDMEKQEWRHCWRYDRVFVPNETLILRWQAPSGLAGRSPVVEQVALAEQGARRV